MRACVCVCVERGVYIMYLYMCAGVGICACVFLCVFCLYFAIVSWFTSDLMHQDKICRCREEVCLFNIQDSCSFRYCVSALTTVRNSKDVYVYYTDIDLEVYEFNRTFPVLLRNTFTHYS